jgi:hypothetical protein
LREQASRPSTIKGKKNGFKVEQLTLILKVTVLLPPLGPWGIAAHVNVDVKYTAPELVFVF